MTITGAGTNVRPLAPGQRARLLVGDIEGGEPRLVYETADSALEAPNWSPDGRWLVVNQDGLLLRIPAGTSHGDGVLPEVIDTGGITDANNDHVLSPDGATIYLSAGDGHIHAVPFTGGPARRVTNDRGPAPFRHFLHGVSPDGLTLSYVGIEPDGSGDEWGRRNIFTLPAAGGPDTRLTDGPAPADGPEFTPDGAWILFNSEHGATIPGHAQLFRMRPDGSGLTRLTSDERVNWFPHPSPDGRHILYVSFPPGTEGHPADRDVILRLLDCAGGAPRDLLAFLGGQGSLNVNSWSPDSRHFAYVDYPVGGPPGGLPDAP